MTPEFYILSLFLISSSLKPSLCIDCNAGDKYQITVEKVLGSEGLCQNSKSDPGNTFQGQVGYTCLGLTPATVYNNRDEFPGCKDFKGHPADFSKFCYDKNHDDFRKGAITVYKNSYFKPCDDLAMPAFYVCSDISVNSGQGTAQRYRKELGPPGNNSRGYARKLNEKHRELYKSIGGPNLKGWLNRAADRDKYIDSCDDNPPPPPTSGSPPPPPPPTTEGPPPPPPLTQSKGPIIPPSTIIVQPEPRKDEPKHGRERSRGSVELQCNCDCGNKG